MFTISGSVNFSFVCCSLVNNFIITRQIDDVDVFYCVKCIVVILSNCWWLISVYNSMDDWKLKARVVVKLKREANTFVSLYHVSCFIPLFNDFADFDFERSSNYKRYLFCVWVTRDYRICTIPVAGGDEMGSSNQ